MLPYKNSPSSKAIPILLFSLLALQSLQHQCIHDHLESDIKINSPSYAIYPHTPGRFLQEYQNISILIDSSNLDNVTDDFKDYILNSIMPAVTNYIQAALRVPTRSSNIKAGGYSALCSGDVKIPSKYNKDGVDYDLVMFVKAKNDSKASYVAAASTCLLDTTTRRPIMGRMTYNLAKVSATTNDAQREKDIVTTLHEMTHALGFSNSLYPYYVDSETGQDLKGHIKSQTVMGFPTTILNLEPLTTRLQAHFNCSSLAGAYLENQGGTGSAGSHFERRIFYNEYMTASSVVDARITEFTLALLEGTGWYQINYDMAESITWGKNKGCEFVTGPCVNKTTKKANFEEFCSPIIAKSCSWTKRSGSSCGAFRAMKNSSLPSAIDWWGNNTISQDIFSDNCPIQLGYNNLDCEDPDNEGGATLKAETYGYGSRCFMGTLYPKGGLASPYPYCFKSQCKQGTNGDYYLEVRVGSVTVNCTSERQRKVSGYAGALYCPDPQKFCNQVISEGTCRRKCTGRGTCVQNECVCNDGWGGFDCSKRIIVDQCSACANGDPLKTSCFGDQCACNPSNITCMCALGLQKGSLCAGLTTKTINATLTLKEANIDSQAISINSINQTIAERASTFNGERDIANKGETINSETDKEVNILPILLGIVGFLLIAIALFFIVRYARRKLRIMKHTTGTSTKRTRPPKIQISTKSPVMMTDISNPNSPDLLKRGLSLTSHNESPLMKCSSPFREAYTPSRFKDYAMNAQAVIRENEEFCLKIHPISFENQIENVEDKHQEDEKCTPVSFSLPELGQSVPQKTNVHRTSIQYF